MISAAIYGPARDIGRWQPICTAWCSAQEYELHAEINETAGATRWGDVLRMMADREVDIVVVATLADLPPERTARVEIVGRGQPVRRPGCRVVIYGPPWAGPRWGRRVMRWCQQAGYNVRDLVVETADASQWPRVVRMMADQEVDLVVMESWGHLPPHRLPRVEVAGVNPAGLLQPRAAGWYR